MNANTPLARQWIETGDEAPVDLKLSKSQVKFLMNGLINEHNESIRDGQQCQFTDGLLMQLSIQAQLNLEAK